MVNNYRYKGKKIKIDNFYKSRIKKELYLKLDDFIGKTVNIIDCENSINSEIEKLVFTKNDVVFLIGNNTSTKCVDNVYNLFRENINTTIYTFNTEKSGKNRADIFCSSLASILVSCAEKVILYSNDKGFLTIKEALSSFGFNNIKVISNCYKNPSFKEGLEILKSIKGLDKKFVHKQIVGTIGGNIAKKRGISFNLTSWLNMRNSEKYVILKGDYLKLRNI